MALISKNLYVKALLSQGTAVHYAEYFQQNINWMKNYIDKIINCAVAT